MPLLSVRFFSETLKVQTEVTVILPQQASEAEIGVDSRASAGDQGFPVLYLLHGLSDDHTIWTRHTSIERHVKAHGLAVVMPSVGRSFYTDMLSGPDYWSYVSRELPEQMGRMLRISRRREDTFVAGLSMGGYGAFKLALHQPERFAAAASLSGALDPADLERRMSDLTEEWQWIFGGRGNIEGSDADLFAQSKRLAGGEYGDLPLYQCCGTEDVLYQDNLRFRDHARDLGLALTYEEHDGRGHTWDYWDEQIQRVLEWLPLRNQR